MFLSIVFHKNKLACTTCTKNKLACLWLQYIYKLACFCYHVTVLRKHNTNHHQPPTIRKELYNVLRPYSPTSHQHQRQGVPRDLHGSRNTSHSRSRRPWRDCLSDHGQGTSSQGTDHPHVWHDHGSDFCYPLTYSIPCTVGRACSTVPALQGVPT